MKIAHRHRVPVTPRGTGTSVTGAVLPIRGGLLLDLHLMNHILEINREDFYAPNTNRVVVEIFYDRPEDVAAELGVSPRDMISIFQALREAGALEAELVIM